MLFLRNLSHYDSRLTDRAMAFLSILRGVLVQSQTCRPVKFRRAHRVFRNLLTGHAGRTGCGLLKEETMRGGDEPHPESDSLLE